MLRNGSIREKRRKKLIKNGPKKRLKWIKERLMMYFMNSTIMCFEKRIVLPVQIVVRLRVLSFVMLISNELQNGWDFPKTNWLINTSALMKRKIMFWKAVLAPFWGATINARSTRTDHLLAGNIRTPTERICFKSWTLQERIWRCVPPYFKLFKMLPKKFNSVYNL